MRVPIGWLREYVDIEMSVSELADLLIMGGMGVEEITGEGEDAVFVLEITSNRGDCLSMVGVAREVAALSGAARKCPACNVCEDDTIPAIAADAAVEILDADLCPRYAARLVRGVSVGESPAWMRARLDAGGIRPINSIVDVTNYVMLELGQPLHAFDYATLRGRRIIVRRAREGEKLTTIDGVERQLTNSMLVIADAEMPVAIAGVMGGLDTEVTQHTVDILLESAHFDPLSIRRTAHRLGMSTEASYRFERWVDPSGCVLAANRAARLMAEISGGKVARGVIDVYPRRLAPAQVALQADFVNRRLGVQIPASDMLAMLQRLEIKVHGDNPMRCEIPTFRHDITRREDLVEEIARLYGYNNIPVTIPSGVSPHAGEGPKKRLVRRAREVMVRCGLQEVCTFSLTRPAALERAGVADAANPLQLRNPLTEDYTILRTSIIPSLLEVLSHNVNAGITDVHIFEIGKTYHTFETEKLPEERNVLGIALMGVNWPQGWGQIADASPSDFFTLKGIINHLLDDLGIRNIRYEPLRSGSKNCLCETFHPGRCAQVVAGDSIIAVLGEVHPNVAANYDLLRKAYVASIQLDVVIARADLHRRYTPLPRFPSVNRDVAMVLPVDVSAETVQNLIRETAGALLESVVLFDVYTGKNIEFGKRSLAFSLTFRSPERTLTEQEADASLATIKAALCDRLGAVIREG